MAVGQSVLTSTLDVGAVDAVEARLADREVRRGAEHAEALLDALELLRLYDRAGMRLGVPSQLAVVWRCSETRATTLLTCAEVLAELAAAFDLLACGVMTVEQSGAVGRVLDPLPHEVRDAVWARAVVRLRSDAERGSVCPPARLTELLRAWAVEVDPDAAVERRRRAEADGSVLLHRRDDGLHDVVLSGLTAPLAEAVLSRVTVVGEQGAFVGDERTAGRRRLDAAVDLLLGRTGRPAGECAPAGGVPGDAACAGGCGCALGAPVPCGASVTVLVPLATALGVGDVPAQQPGAGPVEPDLLAALLGSAPVLRAVWVEPDGTPVTAPGRAERPGRGGDAVRQALRRLVEAGPGPRQPEHPGDHDHDHDPRPDDGPPDDPPPPPPPPSPPSPPPPPPSGSSPYARPPAVRGPSRRPALLAHPHPPDTPGPYRVPASLRRFLSVRAPRCEWPGCGVRAARCDLDHDVPHPYGPTCPCNAGPLCRRHHRVKQLGWTKQRTAEGVRWTSPTLRATLSVPSHLPVPAVRAVRPAATSLLDQLSPGELEDALHPADPYFDGRDHDGTGDWLVAERDAERRWWSRQLVELRHAARAARPAARRPVRRARA